LGDALYPLDGPANDRTCALTPSGAASLPVRCGPTAPGFLAPTTTGQLHDGHPVEVVLVGVGLGVQPIQLDRHGPAGHVVDDGKDGDKGLVAVRLVGPRLGRADRVGSDEDLHADKLGSGAAPPGPRGRDDEPRALAVVGAGEGYGAG
jgi:hypothetical protein